MTAFATCLEWTGGESAWVTTFLESEEISIGHIDSFEEKATVRSRDVTLI
jgi:hypothetical protein